MAESVKPTVRVEIGMGFLDLTEGERTVEVSGDNVFECLKCVKEKYPKFSALLEKIGETSLLVICLNDSIIYPDEIDHPVREGDVIRISAIAAGG